MNQSFYGWKLLAAVWVILALTMGFAVYGGTIMNTTMITEMHWDRKSLGLVAGSFALFLGLISPLTGFLVHKLGAKIAFSIGAVIVALGALAMATIVNSVVGAAIGFGLVMGSGTTLCGTIPAQALIGYWFRKRVALALTIMTTGAVAGGVIATQVLTKVMVATNNNWRIGWFIVAAACAFAFICITLFIKNKPADIGQVQDGVAEGNPSLDANAGSQPASGVYKTTEDWTFKNAIRHPTFWMMLFGLAFSTIGAGMTGAHGMVHYKDLGHSPEMVAMFLSTMYVSSLVGKGIFAILGDRIEPRFLWSTALIFQSIGMAMAVHATSIIELYVSGFLLGVGPSVVILSMFTLATNYFGKTAYPMLMGVAGLFLALVPAIGAVLTGMVYDHFGSYAQAFYTESALCIMGCLMIPFARPPVRAFEKLAQGLP